MHKLITLLLVCLLLAACTTPGTAPADAPAAGDDVAGEATSAPAAEEGAEPTGTPVEEEAEPTGTPAEEEAEPTGTPVEEEGEDITGAEEMTGTEGITGTDGITGAEEMTGTGEMEGAEGITGTEEMTGTGDATGAAGGSAMAGTVMLSQSAEFGEILTDGEGRTLYLFTQDTPDASTCTGGCLENWPAFTVEGEAMAGEGVDQAMLGAITRDDGTTQVTYNGHPLYYYVDDVSPGDTTGQAVGDVWYVVDAQGNQVQ